VTIYMSESERFEVLCEEVEDTLINLGADLDFDEIREIAEWLIEEEATGPRRSRYFIKEWLVNR
jgi:hypothetical protein